MKLLVVSICQLLLSMEENLAHSVLYMLFEKQTTTKKIQKNQKWKRKNNPKATNKKAQL